MVISNLIGNIIAGGTSIIHLSDSVPMLVWKIFLNGSLLAQHVDVDLWADVQNSFNNFVQSGQIWAMLVGFFLGYFIRGMYTIG